MATQNVLDGYPTRADLAQQLHKCERTLDRWAAQRTGPPRTVIGQTIFYDIEDVRTWLRDQRENRPQRRKGKNGRGPKPSGKRMTRSMTSSPK